VVSRVAPTDASVFISGESGTGKELIARAIHAHSRRSATPFMAINCAALPDHLLESELFGHEKGAFTGADSQRRGLLEVASGGTFFLDEISEMSMDLQAKLLRVIQERKIRRVGGEAEIPIDVRWVSATNRDPEQAVRDGQLRQDLLYRLNVVPVRLPPLRERREDIPALAQHFLKRFARDYDRANLRFSQEALKVLTDLPVAGNVRELQNVVERVVSLCLPSQEITPEDLPEELSATAPVAGRPGLAAFSADQPFHEAKSSAITEFEKEYLRDLLRGTTGTSRRRRAARASTARPSTGCWPSTTSTGQTADRTAAGASRAPTARSSARAAASGSGARISALITATPAAPARTTAAAVAASIPPIPTTGTATAAATSAIRSAPPARRRRPCSRWRTRDRRPRSRRRPRPLPARPPASPRTRRQEAAAVRSAGRRRPGGRPHPRGRRPRRRRSPRPAGR
jgi:hypothetical protein